VENRKNETKIIANTLVAIAWEEADLKDFLLISLQNFRGFANEGMTLEFWFWDFVF
jgi:hypothetical protein